MNAEVLRQQLESLNEVSTTLRNCQSIEEAVQKALVEVRKRLDVQVASIFLLSKDGVLKREGIDGVDQGGNPIDNSWFFEEQYAPGESFSGGAVPRFEAESSYGNPQYSNKILEKEMVYTRPYLEKLGCLRCGISVPLNGSSRTFGTLEVLNKQDSEGFSQEDVYWLMIIGTNVANFIVNFRKKKRLRAYQKVTQILVDLEASDRSFSLEKFYQLVANELVSDFTPYKACIIRIADEKNDLEIRAKSSHLESNFWQKRKDGSVKSGSQIVGNVYKTQKPVFINIDDSNIELFNNKEWIRDHELKSFACLPLSVQDKCVGTISVYTQYSHKFSDNYRTFLENMAFLTAAITARSRIINDLRKMRKERNNIREKFFNASLLVGYDNVSQGILHQYKNELINVYQFLEKISKDSNISEEEKEEIINKQKEWIKQRVDQILPELKTDEVAPIDINKAIREVVKSFSFEFSEVDIRVEELYDETIPLMALKKQEIQDIIYNLLSNAEKAIQKAKKETGRIVITTSINKSELIQYIQITVENNGIEISRDIWDKVFEKGFTTHQQEGGTGFGLFVVRAIINNLGGKIYFNSSTEKGTAFYVKIPLKRYQC
jgi:signal transduction histidine kinase